MSTLCSVLRTVWPVLPRLLYTKHTLRLLCSDASEEKQPRERHAISSVGRKIQQRHLQVMGPNGEHLGVMHRADVIRLMDQQALKLVPLDMQQQPPVYRLMSGKQIHQEQLKQRVKDKLKEGPIQVKELSFSADVGTHDLHTRLQQVQSWLHRKHHVRLTLKKGSRDTAVERELEQIIHSMNTPVGFISKPQLIQNGRAAFCVLRPATEREKLDTSV